MMNDDFLNLFRSFWETPDGKQQLVENVTAGLERVRREKYAFILESMVADYHVNRRPCDLIKVGNNFGSRSYGLAVPKNSDLLEEFHTIILQLEEEGDLEEV